VESSLKLHIFSNLSSFPKCTTIQFCPIFLWKKPTGTIKVQIGSTDSILIEYDIEY
jgi:hypothetical protein